MGGVPGGTARYRRRCGRPSRPRPVRDLGRRRPQRQPRLSAAPAGPRRHHARGRRRAAGQRHGDRLTIGRQVRRDLEVLDPHPIGYPYPLPRPHLRQGRPAPRHSNSPPREITEGSAPLQREPSTEPPGKPNTPLIRRSYRPTRGKQCQQEPSASSAANTAATTHPSAPPAPTTHLYSTRNNGTARAPPARTLHRSPEEAQHPPQTPIIPANTGEAVSTGTVCQLCRKHSGDNAPVCTTSAHHTHTALRTVADWLAEDLDTLLTRQTRYGTPPPPHPPTPPPPPPRAPPAPPPPTPPPPT